MKPTDELIIEVTTRSLTMASAAAELKMHFNTFKRHAVRLDVYSTNQAGRGIKRKAPSSAIPLQDILDGNHPSYQTFKLKQRLYKAGLKENVCDICGIDSWIGAQLNCELDHIDGDRTNHKFVNLRIICPNCHSQTKTFRARNIRN